MCNTWSWNIWTWKLFLWNVREQINYENVWKYCIEKLENYFFNRYLKNKDIIYIHLASYKFKDTKGYSEAVIGKTDNAMAKRKRTEGQTMICVIYTENERFSNSNSIKTGTSGTFWPFTFFGIIIITQWQLFTVYN